MVVCTVDKLLEVLCLLRVLDAAQFFDFYYKLVYRMHDFVCMRDGWVGCSFALEVHSVGESFFPGGFYMACVCAVVIW